MKRGRTIKHPLKKGTISQAEARAATRRVIGLRKKKH